MKLIDLYNKIVNGEIPEMIEVNNIIWRYDNSLNDYKDKTGRYLMDRYNMLKCLDYDVEILEENLEEKKIPEKLEIINEKNCKNNWKWKVKGEEYYYNISTPQKIIADKINQVIDYLKSKGE